MIAVYLKELKSYFGNFLGYLFVSVMMLFIGFFTVIYNISYSVNVFEYVYDGTTFFYLLAIPILTMRIISEERRQRTDQLLYSLPLKMSSVVMGKYFAAVTVLAIPCAVSAVYPLIYSIFGTMNFRVIYTTLLCFFLLGAALIAVCMFISALTESQIVSAIVSFILVFTIFFAANLTSLVSDSAILSVIFLTVAIILFCIATALVTKNKVMAEIIGIVLMLAVFAVWIFKSDWIETFASGFMEKIALFSAFENAVNGVFDITTVLLYLSVAFLFNFFSIQALEKRRWA